MTPIGPNEVIGVVGAGHMGAGIAQVALLAGHRVRIFDADPQAVRSATGKIDERLTAMTDRSDLTTAEAATFRTRLAAVHEVEQLDDCGVIIEAVIENLDIKRELFRQLEVIVPSSCLLATNTSSLSISAIAADLADPSRLVGIHFFNPAPVMRLVEVVSGATTDPSRLDAAEDLVRRWGKTSIRVASHPGFLVNRVARPFYGEGMRLIDQRSVEPATLDALLVEGAGFRLGPCALTDLIGQDVSVAVGRAVWSACGFDPRFAPSTIQQTLLDARRLGRKSGAGFFDYHSGEQPQPVTSADNENVTGSFVLDGMSRLTRRIAEWTSTSVQPGDAGHVLLPGGAVMTITDGRLAAEIARKMASPVVLVDAWNDDVDCPRVAISRSGNCTDGQMSECVGLLQRVGFRVTPIDDVPGLVVSRIIAMLVDEAASAVERGTAAADDIDRALRLALNYPLGPFEWCERLGAEYVVDVLDNLRRTYGDPRYRVCALLRRSSCEKRTVAEIARVINGPSGHGIEGERSCE